MKFVKAIVFHKRNWPKANKFLYKCNYISIKFPQENKKISFFSLNKFNLLSVYEQDYANGNADLFKWCSNLLKNKYNLEKIDNLELITMPRVFGYALIQYHLYFVTQKKKLFAQY